MTRPSLKSGCLWNPLITLQCHHALRESSLRNTCQSRSATLDHCCPGLGKSSRAGVRSNVVLEAVEMFLNCIDTCLVSTLTRIELALCGSNSSLAPLRQLMRLGGGNLTIFEYRSFNSHAPKFGAGKTTTRDAGLDSASVTSVVCTPPDTPMSSAFQYREALCEWPVRGVAD